LEKTTTMTAKSFDAGALVRSPMVNTSLLLPQVLLDEIDKAAIQDDPSSPNRSSWMRRALIDRLKREAAQ
jgi:metal-responsive CopG/Arc/MetJ family transcriptional regulator